MKKEIKYTECYCDRCGDKVQRLFGRNDGFYTVFLYKDPEKQTAEECKLIPNYYRRYKSAVKACFEDSGICIKCLRQILQKALEHIVEEYPELIDNAER